MKLNACSPEQVELLSGSDLFDRDWYRQRYPDVDVLKIDPALHYLWLGAALGRDPSPLFSTSAYLALNADVERYVQRHDANPLVHYLTSGRHEGRNIAPVEDGRDWDRIMATAIGSRQSRDRELFGNNHQTPARPAAEMPLGIVIHAFYPEVLSEIITICDAIPTDFQFYVSTVPQKYEAVHTTLTEQKRPFRLFSFTNRGRDVLPLLKIMAAMVDDGVEVFAKVHTKRSLHRTDGVAWRKLLYEAVIGREAFSHAIAAMREDPRIGLLGPVDHFVSMRTYLGRNFVGVSRCAEAFGANPSTVFDLGFFAGTMFVARLGALRPLLDFGFADEDFEPEAGQIDGTLAHVIERILTICVTSGGYMVGSTIAPYEIPRIIDRYEFV